MASIDNGETVPNSKILVGMVSLGCPKNLVDGESMLGLLVARGYGITPDADLADLIIVNTCGFIDTAKRESIDAILEMADKKASGRRLALIVTGCLSERYRASFPDELPEVDAALGAGEYGRICEVADALVQLYGLGREGPAGRGNPSERVTTGPPAIKTIPKSPRNVRESTPEQRLEHLKAARVLTNGSGYVYIKIAEGCDNNCSYCVIPSIRGPYISRPAGDIVAEARRLSAEREIEAVLVAQDTTNYGSGAAPRGAFCGPDAERAASRTVSQTGTAPLRELVGSLSGIENVRWIRLMYAYPDRIDERLAELFSRGNKLLRYIDMPIQHASSAVLRGMGRKYDQRGLYDVVATLRRHAPDIVIRTTVMTGFPGESDADFAELAEFIKQARFDRLGVFAYSREEGTLAADLDGQIPEKTAQKRRSELLRVQASVMARLESERIGREYEAIVDSGPHTVKGGDAVYRVRTYAEAPEIDGNIRVRAPSISGKPPEPAGPGSFVRIKITGRDTGGLYGVMLT